MWIRTQDKKRLILIHEIEMNGERTINLINDTDKESYSAIVNSDHNTWIAYYSSFEKAQRVLDMLQQAILENKTCFQMPEDCEVKI